MIAQAKTQPDHKARAKWSRLKVRLLEEMPKHGWDYVNAGIAAGYKESYAKARLKYEITKDVEWCRALLAKRAEIEAGTTDERDKCLRVLDEIIHSPNAHHRDRIKAIGERAKICGWIEQKIILETPQRQHELEQANAEQARQLAILWGQTARLPGETVSNATIQPSQGSDSTTTEPIDATFEPSMPADAPTKPDQSEVKPGPEPAEDGPEQAQEQAGAENATGQDGPPMPPIGGDAQPSPDDPQFSGAAPKGD